MPAVTTPGQPSWSALISRAMLLIASKDAEKGDGPLSPKCLAVLDTLRGMRDEPDPEAFTGPGDPLFKSYRSYRKNADQWQPDKGPRGGNRWRRGSVVRYFPDGVNPNQTGATDRASRNAVRGAAKAERQKLTADAAHAQLADVFASGEVPEDAPDRVHAVLSGMYRDEVRKLGVLLGTSQTGAMKDLVAKVAEAAVGRAKAGGWKRAEEVAVAEPVAEPVTDPAPTVAVGNDPDTRMVAESLRHGLDREAGNVMLFASTDEDAAVAALSRLRPDLVPVNLGESIDREARKLADEKGIDWATVEGAMAPDASGDDKRRLAMFARTATVRAVKDANAGEAKTLIHGLGRFADYGVELAEVLPRINGASLRDSSREGQSAVVLLPVGSEKETARAISRSPAPLPGSMGGADAVPLTPEQQRAKEAADQSAAFNLKQSQERQAKEKEERERPEREKAEKFRAEQARNAEESRTGNLNHTREWRGKLARTSQEFRDRLTGASSIKARADMVNEIMVYGGTRNEEAVRRAIDHQFGTNYLADMKGRHQHNFSAEETAPASQPTAATPAPSPVDHVAAAAAMHQEARDQLATYEQAYTAAGGTPDAHRQALKASGLTGEGLRHARKVAGKFGTKGPGIATARAGADVPAEGSQRENGDVFVQGLWYPPSKPVMASGLPESARPKPYQDTPAAPPAHARAQAEAIAHAKGKADRLRARGMTDDADHYAQVADYLGSADAGFWTQHAAGRGVEQVTQVAGELMGKQKPVATATPAATPKLDPIHDISPDTVGSMWSRMRDEIGNHDPKLSPAAAGEIAAARILNGWSEGVRRFRDETDRKVRAGEQISDADDALYGELDDRHGPIVRKLEQLSGIRAWTDLREHPLAGRPLDAEPLENMAAKAQLRKEELQRLLPEQRRATPTPITPPLGAKPADVAALREAMGETGAKEGDRNERGEVLRGSRWHQDREEEAVAKRQPADAYAAGKQNAGDGANGYNQAIHGLAAVIKDRTGRDVSAGDIADRWHNPLASVRGSEDWSQVEQMIRGAYRSPGDPPNAWWVTQGVRDYGYTSHALENQMDDFVRNKAPGIKDWAAGVREQAQDMQAIVPDFDGAAKAIAKADYWEKAVDQHVERFKQTIAAKKEADAEAFRKEQESQKFSRDMGTVELKVPQTAGLMKRLRESSPGMLTLAQEQGWFTDGKVLFRLSPKEKAEADKLPATGSKPPDIQSVLEPAKKARATEAAEVTGHRKSPKDAKMTEFHLSDGKRQASVDGALFETIRRRFPKATAHLGRKPSDPILFRQGDEVIGLLMPLTRPDDFKAEYKDAEPTVTKRYPRPACPSSWRHRYHA